MIKIEDIKNISPNVKSNISKEAQDIFTPDEKRNENEKKHLHWVKIIFIWTIFIGVIVIGIIILVHLILPLNCRWLPKEEIMNLKSMFVSGIGGAILTKFGNKIVQ